MKKIAVQIEYQGNIYQGDFDEHNEEEETKILRLIDNVMIDGDGYLTLKSGRITYYFSRAILDQSIIGLVYDE